MTERSTDATPEPSLPLIVADADETAPPTPSAAPKRRRRSAPANATGTATEGQEPGLLATLERIENLLMILVRRAVQPALQEELKDSTARAIYEATGEKTARDIAQTTGVGVATVSRTWARWESLGLIVKEGSRYRRPF